MSIATIPTGFGDGGYMIKLADVLIGGVRCPVLGLVASSVFAAENKLLGYKGEKVVLIGKQEGEEITVGELANRNNMIEMQLVTMLGSRLQKVYTT